MKVCQDQREINWKACGFRACLDTHEGDAGQFHVFHDTLAGVTCLEAQGGDACPCASWNLVFVPRRSDPMPTLCSDLRPTPTRSLLMVN